MRGEELSKIGTAEECASTVTIWVVRDGDDLYVRSVNGPAGGAAAS
jgi:hypothetical protein